MLSLMSTSKTTMLSPLVQRAIMPASRLDSTKNALITSTTRRFGSPSKKCVVINSVGVDRTGIVADITKFVTDKGGSVGESHSQMLGGHFSIMMLVDFPRPENITALNKQLQTEVAGMTTSCFGAADAQEVDLCPRIGFAGEFKLSGADNPGLVHKLTSVLARSSLTIGSMTTSREGAPHGGTELFTMEGRAIAYEPLASNFDYSKVKQQLQELGESINCDVEFEDVS